MGEKMGEGTKEKGEWSRVQLTQIRPQLAQIRPLAIGAPIEHFPFSI